MWQRRTLLRWLRRWQVLVWIALLWLLGAALLTLPAWQAIEKKGYDWLTVASPRVEQKLPITLIAIDDPSLEAVGSRWPWSRQIQARLIDRLHALGAIVIVFDVVFALPTNAADDQAMAEAIRRAGSVVLAAERVRQDTAYGMMVHRLDPLPLLVQAGAKVGLANVEMDRDLVMRSFPEQPDILWRAMHGALAQQVGLGPIAPLPAGALLRHLGPSPSFPVLSAAVVLGQTLPAGALEGQLAFVGRITEGALELGTEVDLFATPFTAFNGNLTPGVEIQATFLENAVRDLIITPAPRLWQLLLIGLMALLGCLSASRLGVFWAGVVSTALLLVLLGSGYALFVWRGVWLPLLAPALMPTLTFVAKFARSIFDEQQHKQQIKSMFSLYVPAHVVERLVAHPEQLVLGGETRQITVLFCDMQGFTGLSESLPAQQVAALINRYLDCLSQVIFDHGGTVDKYIGDAIMAFWGAPLDDPEHARHALQAVQQMFASLPALNAELRRHGLPAVDVRMGLHSGEAVVGNLGSRGRFSYTAVGDTVNLAARLEPMGKNYGVRLVFSETTLALARASGLLPWPVQELGQVTARGKTQAVHIFTLSDLVAAQPQEPLPAPAAAADDADEAQAGDIGSTTNAAGPVWRSS